MHSTSVRRRAGAAGLLPSDSARFTGATTMHASDWHTGDNVLVRGRPWIIRGTEAWPDCSVLRLAPDDPTPGHAFTILTPFDRPVRVDRVRRAHVLRVRQWLRAIRGLQATLVPFGGCRAAPRPSVRLLPYQLEPVLAVFRHGATRLLIADEVGLGKTMEAGWVVVELMERCERMRAVVLAPAGLREQWATELREHFGIATVQADAAWLRASELSHPADVNPWSLPGIYILSIDFAKRPEVLRGLEEVAWDLMILDEAHIASAATDRRAAAHALACRSKKTISLTATPELGDDDRFRALCEIGRITPTEPPVVFFRRTRADVSDAPPRRSRLLRIEPTAAERRMHELLERYTAAVWSEATARHDHQARLATIVLRKRALSSAGSLAASARRRLELLTGTAVVQARQMLLPLDDPSPQEDDGDEVVLGAPGLADARRESRWLATVGEAARGAARDESKARFLLRLLSRISEPVIVFTEYRDTLQRIERVLRRAGRPLVTLHGGLDRAERSRVQRAFNRGGLSLLATDAASEGLNLHRCCRVVIHYELPWRPARMEQRAGRVDRLGQDRRVHEIALLASGTAERLVLAPLVARAARARAAGDPVRLLDALTEAQVAETIVGGRELELPSPTAPRSAIRILDLREEACREAARLEYRNRICAEAPGVRAGAGHGPIVSSRRSFGQTAGMFLVFTLLLHDRWKRPVHAQSCVLFVRGTPKLLLNRSAGSMRRLATLVEEMKERPGLGIRERLRNVQQEMRSRIAATYSAAAERTHIREEALRHVHTSAAREMVQAGLFERRALRAASHERAVQDARLYEIGGRQDAPAPADPLDCAIELSGILVCRRGAR
jgi:superfamily II DNA or RNA helicase